MKHRIIMGGTGATLIPPAESNELFGKLFASNKGIEYLNEITGARCASLCRMSLKTFERMPDDIYDNFEEDLIINVQIFLKVLLEQSILSKKSKIKVEVVE